MINKLAVLHTLLAGLLVTAWFMGWLPILLAADKYHAIPLIGGVTLVGIGMVARSAVEGALWLADKLPAMGLAMTVTGLLWAANGLLGGGGVDTFKVDVINALVGNLMGILGYLWLELVVKVAR